MINTISFKIDQNNDLYEITVNNETYTIDDVYDSEYGELFDELNIVIETLPVFDCNK